MHFSNDKKIEKVLKRDSIDIPEDRDPTIPQVQSTILCEIDIRQVFDKGQIADDFSYGL
jgi:hypothetical protein